MSLEQKVIDRLLEKQPRLYVVASGAGAGIQKKLWDRPGTSKYLVGARFPYDRADTAEFLGFEPAKAVSRETAIQFAQAAYLRACRGSGAGTPIGLGLTAAVTTDRERKGSNVVEAVVMSPTQALHMSLTLPKDSGEHVRMRDGERADVVAFYLLSVLLNGSSDGWIEPVPEQELRAVLYKHPLFLPSGARGPGGAMVAPLRRLLIPGSFNPLHFGHDGMASVAEERSGRKPAFVLAADTVHKPSLATGELLRRVSQFHGHDFPILLTQRDPLYIHKARQFPGRWFAIGLDTLERMLESKWFAKAGTTDPIEDIDSYWVTNGDIGIHAMLAEFRALGTRFLVFGRNGKQLWDVNVPGDFRDLFEPLPGTWNISSTELRKAAGG